MKNRLGIVAECLKGVTARDALPMIKKAGFESVFTNSYSAEEVKMIKAETERLGLAYTFLHAPFDNINSMWVSGDEYIDIYNRMMDSVDVAAQCGVPAVVLHLSSGWYPPAISDIGLERFDSIVDHAGELEVTVAFENLRVIGNLAYFTERYEKNEYVKYCYDSGHEHAYTKYVDWMDIFRDKAYITHIHDNFGRGAEKTGDPDMHLLPFDGTFDFSKMMRKLREYDFAEDLTLEVFNSMSPEYLKMGHEEFLSTAYKRLVKISQM